MSKSQHKGKELLPISVIHAARAGDAEAWIVFFGTIRGTSISSAPGNSVTSLAVPMIAWTST